MDNITDSDIAFNTLHQNDGNANLTNNEVQTANLNTLENLNVNSNNFEISNKTILDENENVLEIIDDDIFDDNDKIDKININAENPMIDDISYRYDNNHTIIESISSLDDTEHVYNKTLSQIEEEDISIQSYRNTVNPEKQSITDYNQNESSIDLNRGAKLDIIELCYSVVIDNKLKKILKNVSFSLLPGTLCALMGPSSAGKR